DHQRRGGGDHDDGEELGPDRGRAQRRHQSFPPALPTTRARLSSLALTLRRARSVARMLISKRILSSNQKKRRQPPARVNSSSSPTVRVGALPRAAKMAASLRRSELATNRTWQPVALLMSPIRCTIILRPCTFSAAAMSRSSPK